MDDDDGGSYGPFGGGHPYLWMWGLVVVLAFVAVPQLRALAVSVLVVLVGLWPAWIVRHSVRELRYVRARFRGRFHGSREGISPRNQTERLLGIPWNQTERPPEPVGISRPFQGALPAHGGGGLTDTREDVKHLKWTVPILDVLSEPLSGRQVAERLGASRSVTHTTLLRLEGAWLVERDAQGRWIRRG